MKTAYRFVSILFVIVLLAGCIATPRGSNVPTNATELRQFYSDYVSAEIELSAFYKKVEASYSQGFSAIKEKYATNQACYSNLDQLIKDAMAGRFSPPDANGNPTSEVNAQIAIDVYAPTEAYPGDPKVCQEGTNQLMKDIGVWRKDNADSFAQVYDRIAVLKKMRNDDIVKVAAGDLAVFMSEQAKNAGFSYFEKFMFPTYNTEVPSHSEELCNLYTEWALEKKDGYLMPSDWNPVYKTCTLYGLAAEEYMNKVLMPSEVGAIFDTGEETSPIQLTPSK